MTEEEEFEFRLRLEQETKALESIPPFSWARKSGFLKGYMDPAAGLAQFSEKMTPDYLRSPYSAIDKQIKQEEADYQAPEGIDWGRMAGNVASPVTAVSALTPATTIPRLMSLGGALALTQPTTSDDFARSKAIQAVTGAAVGGAIPLVGKAIKGGVHYADELTKPMYERGIQRDVRKFLKEATGESRKKIIDMLSKGKGTAGQTIARANRETAEDIGAQIVGLEKSLSRDPTTGAPLRSIYKAQQRGREKAIGAIAGTDEDLAKAISERARVGYKEAFKQSIKGDSELLRLSKNPYIKKAMATASDLAEANNITPKENLTEFLHYVKIGVDKQLSRTGDDALASAERAAANKAKSQLVGWIKKKNPAYDEARREYAQKSAPINQMQVGRELREALISATEKETPSTFTSAVRHAPRTIKRSTGFSRYDVLDDVLSPEQVKAVSRVSDELIDQAKFTEMARSASSIMKDLPGEVQVSLPHILSRPVVIANAGLKLLGKDRTPKYKEILTGLLEKPENLAEALRATGTKRKVAIELLKEASVIVSSQTTAREVQ